MVWGGGGDFVIVREVYEMSKIVTKLFISSHELPIEYKAYKSDKHLKCKNERWIHITQIGFVVGNDIPGLWIQVC